MDEDLDRQGKRPSEGGEKNPRAAASSEVQEARKQNAESNEGRRPMRLEELLERAKTDPIARDLVDGLNKLNKVTDEKERKELIRRLANSAQMHFHRDIADLKDLQHIPHSKHDKQLEAMLLKGRDMIRFTGDVPKVITQELKALREEERKQGKTLGFVEHAMTMLKGLKESVMAPEQKKSAEQALRESIAEQLAPELKELREKRASGIEKTTLIVGSVKSFDEETVTNVHLLEKALHPPGLFGLPFGEHVDFKQLKEILDGMPVEKRQNAAEAFASESEGQKDFFSELRWRGIEHPADVQEIEAMFQRRKDVTDWAGDLQNDLVKLKELKQKNFIYAAVGAEEMLAGIGVRDPQANNVERAMRQTVSMMPALAIAELERNHSSLYSQLTKAPEVSAETRAALKIMLENPSWSKETESVANLVRLAVDHNNFDLFKDTMTHASPEARQDFSRSKEAIDVLRKYSLQAEVVSDLIANGKESLATGLRKNTSWYGWIGANKEEVERLVEFADPADRAAYTKGQALAKLKDPGEEEKALIDYFRTVDQALKAATVYDKTQYDLLKAKMTGTPEIYAPLRKLHGDGFFGNFQSNDLSGMKKVVENISQENWRSLRENPSHLARLEDDLKTFLSDEERAQIMQMLRAKVGDKAKDNLNYEKSKELGKRSVEDFFREETPHESWNIASQKSCRLVKLERILQLTVAEKNAYKKDPTSIDKLIESHLQGDELLVAKRRLQQIIRGSEVTDSINEALLSNLQDVSSSKRASKLEAAIASLDRETLRNPKTSEQNELRQSFQQIIKRFCDETGRGPRYDQDGQQIYEGQYEEYIAKTFNDGRLPLDLKVALFKESKVSLETLTNLSKQEVQTLMGKTPAAQYMQNELFKSKEQAELAREIFELKNAGDIPEVLRIRAAVVGFDEPLNNTIERLERLKPKERAKLESEYLKYHSTMNADLLHIANGADRRRLVEIYAPVPMGQNIISLQKELTRKDGAADSFIMAGALDAHARLAKVYAENKEAIARLDPKTREELDGALENYFVARANFVATKRETAEAVASATTMLMGVALSIADPPATAAILTSAGVVGAGVKLEMTRAMMGGDFDESQSLKIAGGGFMDISFGFADKIVPLSKLVKLDAKVAAATTDAVCERIGTAKTISLIRQDAREIMFKGLSEMSLTHCAFGSKEFEHEVHKLAKALVKEGADPKEVETLVGLIREETSKRISASLQQKIRNEVFKAGETSTLETGGELTKEAILEPDKLRIDELGIKSSSDLAAALIKYIELRAAGKVIGKTIEHANLQLAKRDLFESAKSLPKENFVRVIKHTKVLESRISDPKETAKTLREVAHFFKPRENGLDIDFSKVPNSEDLKFLGQQTLYELAHPEMIHQGDNNTCNATVVQKQLAFNLPYRYAQMQKEAAKYDRWTTADGTSFRPSEFGAFIDDRQTSRYWQSQNDTHLDLDLHRQLSWRPTEKIMQTALVNAHWQRIERQLNIVENADGVFIAPPETKGAFLRKYAPGEIAFLGTDEESRLCYRKDGAWLPFKNLHPEKEGSVLTTSPFIGSEHIEDMFNQTAGQGHFDQGFVLIGPAPANANPAIIESMSRSQTFVESPEQLQQIIKTRAQSRRGATAIAIDTEKRSPGSNGGGHIILGLYNQAGDKCSIFNSGGKREEDLDFKKLFEILLEEKFDGTPGQ